MEYNIKTILINSVVMLFVYTFICLCYVYMFTASNTTYYMMAAFFIITLASRLKTSITNPEAALTLYNNLLNKGGTRICKAFFAYTSYMVLISGGIIIYYMGTPFGIIFNVLNILWLYLQSLAVKKVLR